MRKPIYSFCSRCEREGYEHRGRCDSKGQMQGASQEELVRMFNENRRVVK